MSNTQIPDLWPASVKVEILTPYAILRAQATKLTERTQGIVEGHVRSRAVARSLICHTFDLLAPVLSFRYTLLRLWHRETMVYPVLITQGLDNSLNPIKILQLIEGEFVHSAFGLSRDEDTLLKNLSQIFTDASSGTVISSLIARTNEARDGGGPILERDDTPEFDDEAPDMGTHLSDGAEE